MLKYLGLAVLVIAFLKKDEIKEFVQEEFHLIDVNKNAVTSDVKLDKVVEKVIESNNIESPLSTSNVVSSESPLAIVNSLNVVNDSINKYTETQQFFQG